MLPGGYIWPQSGAAGAKCACSGTVAPRGGCLASSALSVEMCADYSPRIWLRTHLHPSRRGVVDMRPGSAPIRPWVLTAESWKMRGRLKQTLEGCRQARGSRSGDRGGGMPDLRLERAPSSANALAVCADDRRRARGYLSCRSCRPHAPFAEPVRLSKTSVRRRDAD
jgi:hypothetical protein